MSAATLAAIASYDALQAPLMNLMQAAGNRQAATSKN
jgi:hypothetical protein